MLYILSVSLLRSFCYASRIVLSLERSLDVVIFKIMISLVFNVWVLDLN